MIYISLFDQNCGYDLLEVLQQIRLEFPEIEIDESGITRNPWPTVEEDLDEFCIKRPNLSLCANIVSDSRETIIIFGSSLLEGVIWYEDV